MTSSTFSSSVLDSELIGGAGGSASDALMSTTIGGGAGLYATEVSGSLVVLNSDLTGGAGGTATNSSVLTATGGDALWFSGTGTSLSGTLILSGGTYTGGQGAVATNITTTETIDFNGGRGAFIGAGGTAEIGGGATFTGGDAGTLNGTLAEQGVALGVQDATVTITNGTFIGRKGLVTTSTGGSSDITILGGSFGDVEFGGTDEDITITGGLIDEVLLSGSGVKDIKLGGSVSYEDLLISGTAANTLSISNGVTSSGTVLQSGGTTTIDLWNDDHFVDTTLSNGTMNFNGRRFDLISGASFRLETDTAQANFNDGLMVNSGATLGGAGSLSASSSLILYGTYQCEIDGANADKLVVGGTLDISAGTLDIANLGGGFPQVPYVIATYGSLTGSSFASVTDLPAGCDVDYAYNGNQIALVLGDSFYLWAATYGLSGTNALSDADPDLDALVNSVEFAIGTDPANADTDGDGLTDGEEVNITLTDPLDVDSDDDGLSDGAEVNTHSTDPLDDDSDDDGLSDGAEVNSHSTDPLSSDTDSDGISDEDEVNLYGYDPLVKYDYAGDIRYVDINSTNPVPPFGSWETAADNIQAAIGIALSNDTVLVEDGHYVLSSEITVNTSVSIESVNGPYATVIDGGGSNRCFNLGSSSAVLSGLTVTNGYTTESGGGVYCSYSSSAVVTNCLISGNTASGGGGMDGGTANNCTISGNTADYYGGGMFASTANNCTISGNSANQSGGGMDGGTANNCTISGNTAAYYGGGMYYGTASNCTINGNTADSRGGGMYSSTANNCTISGNTTEVFGGGMYDGTVNNCTINGNTARFGGGIYGGTANNCTIIGNSCIELGGGVLNGVVNNCIVWYNDTASSMGKNIYDCTGANTCSPDVIHGVDGNITNAPLFASVSHIVTNSPCRGSGSSLYSSGVDIDGEPWLNPPSMGCDEYHGTGSVTGLIDLAIEGDLNSVAGQPLTLFADIHGAVTMHTWDFGDGMGATNSPYTTHAWGVPGGYELILTAFNDTYPAGVSVTQVVDVVSQSESKIYVSVQTGNDANDGLGWSTAKASIQAGVDAQLYEGGMVWVSNGTYAVTSEINVEKDIIIQSVAGRNYTIVDGVNTTRCFNLTGRFSRLDGFTIQNGYNTSNNGGGIYCWGATPIVENCIVSNNSANAGGGVFGGVVSNCVIIGNSASRIGGGLDDASAYHCIITNNSAQYGGGLDIGFGNSRERIAGSVNHCIIAGNTAESGGGVRGGIARNCLIAGNHATDTGGGSLDTVAINCTISDNVADSMGGGAFKTINRADCNSIIYYNMAPEYGDMYSISPTTNCCSPDALLGVVGGITAAPLFVGRLDNDYRLQSNSPCINWGNNSYVYGLTDLDGTNRVVEEYVDMGCYEYQGIVGLDGDKDANGIVDEWERQHFGGHVDPNANADGDGSSNKAEYIAGTDPTNSASYFHVTTDTTTNGNPTQHIIINWEAVTGRVYNVMWAPTLATPFEVLEAGIQYPQNSYTDTVHTVESSGFYRVVVMRADYDMDGDGLPNEWESQYAVADGMAHGDGDGFSNLEEFIAGTDPTNSTSFFAAASSTVEVNGTNCFVVEWISIPDRLYSVQWSTNLVSGFQALETDLEHPQHSYTDTTHNAESAVFYKVEVRMK